MLKITHTRLLRSLLLGVFVMLLGASQVSSSFAQSAVSGALGGSVVDQTGATIPNASVAIKNVGTNKEETGVTNNDGGFRFTNLQPGLYSITITATGFALYKKEQITVEVGRQTNVEAKLAISGAAVSVDVVAEASLVNTESKEFATNINQTSINELPTNGRRWSNFAILAPGSVPDGSFGLVSFRGISGLLNNNTIDGGDNNQAFFSEERGRTRISYSVSQSAIREFQVNTSNYSAEYGRAAGGVTNAVTKSGTNEFHGDGFYYQRNNDWGARNPLAFQSVLVNGTATQVGIKPKDVRHQFGGTLGGPLVKDKLFFFFSYDQQKRDFPGLGIFSSPTYLNTVNRNTDPTITTGANAYAASLKNPSRNLSDTQINDAISFLNSLTGTVPRRGDQGLILPKIDWQVNSKNTFTITYNRLRWNSPAGIQTQATNTRGKASFGNDFVKIDWGTVRLVSTLSPRIVNEFRFQYARDFEFQISQTPADGEPRTAINGSAPDVFLTNGLEFGKPTFLERPSYPDERRKQFTDNVTVSMGADTLKFGVDFNLVNEKLANLRNESGAYSYNNINDFIIDYVNWKTPLPATVNCSANTTRFRGKCYTSNFNQGFGPLGAEFSTTDYNAYAQYDWKFLPRVTVNLGLRWEYQRMPDPQLINSSTAIIPNTIRTINEATSFLPDRKNNFGPRTGFAIDLTGDGKTSIRGGYGLYFGRIINSTIYNALINTGNAGGQAQVSIAPTASNAPAFPSVLTSAPAGTGAIQFFAENFNAPKIHQADFIFERQIMRNTTVSASYLLSLGRRLPTFFDRNLTAPTGTFTYAVSGGPLNGQSIVMPAFRGARPNTNFAQMSEIASTVKSEYNALVLQANRRFAKGLQFQTSYTFSKAVDDNQRSATFTENNVPFNVFDPSGERGRSNFDVRHKFVASLVYQPRVKLDNKAATLIADGWSIAPIFQSYTGRPYDAGVTGTLPNVTGLANNTAGGINGSNGANRLPVLARNSFTGPKVWNMDLRLSRRFHLKEKMNFEFLGEVFNITNRTHFTQVNTTMYNLSGTTLNYNTAFGTITEAGGTLYRERQIQLGLRFQF